ncbi:DUF1080 domain-containing protein [Phenylobacterium sp.]|jgi:hypothetical protein|uniref:3-keto-disaccharide hydrolase n=1 Tax=Phenylobacterium sp. TaxID=1871053 RepID=UPI002F926627
MRRALLVLALAAIASHAGAAERWRPIFNGRDLTGWTPKINHHPLGENWRDTFRVKDRKLVVSYDKYDRFKDEFGHLVYKTPLSSYRLRLEYRFVGPDTPGTPAWAIRNSGVMLHGQAPGEMALDQPFPISLEAQFLGVVAGEARGTGNLCTPGTTVTVAGEVMKEHCRNSPARPIADGEWVRFEAEVRGGKVIRHFVNGEKVFEYGDVRLEPSEFKRFANVDPGARTAAPLTSGYISLQAEGHPIEFRKIEVMELKD